ncbi:MAG: hypothetical protein U9N61_07780, partial [Euryarchaeota archaeon]|nr:hypothetical protein [Euryarchaeota archaeon]
VQDAEGNVESTTGAPDNAEYWTASADSGLSDEVVVNSAATLYAALSDVSDFVQPGDTTFDSRYLLESNNLSDLDDASIARTNLDVIQDTADIIKDTHIDWGTGANQVSSSDIPDHNSYTVKDTFEYMLNRGKSSVITVSLTGGLGISWTTGEIYDQANATFVSTDAGSGNLTDNSVNYLKWVSGTTLTIATSTSGSDEILVAIFSVYDGVINSYRETSLMNESIANTRRGLRALFPIKVVSGCSVSEDTDVTNALDVVMDAGVLYKDAIEKKTPVEIKSRNTAMVRHFHTAAAWDYDTNAEIDTSNYDNGTAKTAIPNNKWVKALFIYQTGKIGWVYPTEYFTNKAEALEAPLPSKPPGLEPIPNLTAIVYQQGDADFTSTTWQDVRAGISEQSFNGVTDHGDLAGLSDDDHSIYALLNGRDTNILKIDQISAYDSAGLKLYEDGGKGIFVEDSTGDISIGTTSPGAKLDVDGGARINGPLILDTDISGTLDDWSAQTTYGGIIGITDDNGSHPFNTAGNLVYRSRSSDSAGYGSHKFFVGTGPTEVLTILNNGNVGIGTTSPDRLSHAEKSSALTNTVQQVARFTHVTSGTPAAGIGVGIELEQETSAGNNEVIATIEAITTDVTGASEDADLVLKTMAAGAAVTECARFSNTGFSLFGGTKQAQQAHIVDADGSLADITTKFNTLLADLEGYGLLASS